MNRESPRTVGAEDLERPHPVYVVWELTLRCDQACRHCGSRAGRPRVGELSESEALSLARSFPGLGVREVTLIGGESYLRDDWARLAAVLVAEGIRVSITTGGLHFDERRARAAREAGVSSVSVSVDGLRETHDALRGVPGSFDAAMRALDLLREQGPEPTVNTQIHRGNFRDLETLAGLLAEHGARAWQLQLTTPMGRASEVEDLLIEPYDMLELMPRLAAIARAHAHRARPLRVYASDNLGYFGPFESDLRPGGCWGGCQAGRFGLGILSDGTVQGCASLPRAHFGGMSVREQPLSSIYQDSAALDLLRTRKVEDLWGYCARCYYRELCLGGCPWTSFVLLGRAGNMPFCHHRALELAAAGIRERLVHRSGSSCFEVVEEPLQAAGLTRSS